MEFMDLEREWVWGRSVRTSYQRTHDIGLGGEKLDFIYYFEPWLIHTCRVEIFPG
jgi:hypothetical protein